MIIVMTLNINTIYHFKPLNLFGEFQTMVPNSHKPEGAAMTAPKPSPKASSKSTAKPPRGSPKALAGESKQETLAQNVGRSIARYRKLAGFTQAKVASLLGIETETVSRLETGANSATLERLGQFADLYGCQAAAFFQDETEDAEGIAKTLTGLLRPLTNEERSLMVNFVSEACRLFRRRKDKGGPR
jgi:transcriptional regulator with XRE-family HTH domain